VAAVPSGLSLTTTLRLTFYRQSVRLGDKPLETHYHHFFSTQYLQPNPYVTSSLTREGVLSFTIAAGLRHRSHFQVRVPRDSWPHFTVSDSRLPQPGGPGPRIYIPQEQGDPVIPPGTAFFIPRLLRLVGLRWSYSTSPPHEVCWLRAVRLINTRYTASARTA
jgi:hypothetical protein